jgi:hypothetical protein
MANDNKILMIGVSTAQNTTNVLPALQMKIDYFVALETSAAHARKWSNGMYQVLKDRGIKTLDPIILNPEEDSRIDIISNKLHAIIPDDVEVLWNLGGGQKAQQFALWKTFTERAKNGKDEIACYANPESKKLDIWEFDSETENLEYYDTEINVDISAAEIFSVYGYEIEIGDLLYRNGKVQKEFTGISKLMDFREFREFVFKLPKTSFHDLSNQKELSRSDLKNKQRANTAFFEEKIKIFLKEKLNEKKYFHINEILALVPTLRKRFNELNLNLFLKNNQTETIPITNPSLKTLLKKITGYDLSELEISTDFLQKYFRQNKSSFLFEEILSDKIIGLLPEQTKINEIYSNIKVVKQGKTVGEHDILLVTKWGTIISLDAKTFDVESKDLDARLLNLRNGAGRYVEFIPIFPLYESDIYEEYIPEQILKLPEKIRSKGFRYFTFNNKKNNKKIIWKETEIELSPISTLLTKLDLVKHNN